MWARRLHAAAIACGAYLLCAVGPVPAPAQGEPADAVANADTQTTEAPPLWSSSCSSGGRADPLVCNARQSVVISQTGQRLIVTTLETEPGQPERLYLRVPQGVFIPEGVRFEDDGETVATLPICPASVGITLMRIVRVAPGFIAPSCHISFFSGAIRAWGSVP